MSAIEAVADAIRRADRTVALTGAGVSTESGVPDFRSEGGVWDRFSESDFTGVRFETEPGAFWRDWLAMHDAMLGDVAPNAAHEALAALESRGHLDAVVTQNVDGLHRAAGSERLVHLHGTGDRAICRECDATTAVEDAADRVRDGQVPPYCRNCGGLLKPDTVLFGERLPQDAYEEARTLVETSDVCLVVGSSLSVEPAASLPRHALEWDATLVVVNREPTRYADEASVTFRDDAGTVVPAIADAVDG
jgi:NAD-dependent deacetylase